MMLFSSGKRPRRRLLDLRSGWPLLVAGVLCVAVVAGWLVRMSRRQPTVGDGRNVSSYGFDFSTCLVPRDRIVAAGFPKDGLPAMTDPEVLSVAQVDEYAHELRRAHQGKFLIDRDRVIGVVLRGRARAYPLKILNWHEVVNDTLGGLPIAVTYNPLCDSAVVFDRRVAGELLEFGVSGLVYNSNLLMYDRRPEAVGESLWSQLQFRAVTGPAAVKRRRLKILPAAVVHWADWLKRHPETTVLAPDRSRFKVYQRTYEPYFDSDELLYPVAPMTPNDGTPLKTPMIALRTTGGWHVYMLPAVAAMTKLTGSWSGVLDDVAVRFEYYEDPPAAWLHTEGPGDVETVHCFWFAWHAMWVDEGSAEP